MRPLVIDGRTFDSPSELQTWIESLSREERITLRNKLRKGTDDEVYCSFLADPDYDKFIQASLAKARYVGGEKYTVHFDRLISERKQ